MQNMAKYDQSMTKAWQSMAKACPKHDQSMTKAWQSMALLRAEVLDSCKKVENQLVSFAAVGVSMDEEAVQEATSTCQAADKTIQVPSLKICHDPRIPHG